jgi:hypothetical protein
MLFDLKGRRRRVVQVTYVGLALLMGGGLVLSGIGSDASGGLLDAFVGEGSSGGEEEARKPFENQISDAEKRLATNPREATALATLVRANFGLAGLETEEVNGEVAGYNEKGQQHLQAADRAWGRYLATDPERIDSGLAATAIQIYNVLGPPEDQEKWVRPARELAEQENTAQAYINLFGVATQAGDTRTAGLAERKALSLAESKDERTTIKQRIDEIRQDAAASAGGAGGNGTAPQSP